jgi:hypothetical protein
MFCPLGFAADEAVVVWVPVVAEPVADPVCEPVCDPV